MAPKKTAGSTKLKYLILSIIIAVVAWTVVAYSTDPDMTRTITGVKIELAGAEELQNRGLVALDTDKLPKMSVKVTGKRSDLMSIMDDMRVILDLSGITNAGNYEVQGSVKLPNTRVTVEKIVSDGVNIVIDKLETREVKILIYQDGQVEGKIVETLPKSETVAISGASTELDMINGAYATINLDTVKEEGVVKIATAIAPKDGVTIDDLPTLVLKEKEIEVQNIFYEPLEATVYITSKPVEGFAIDQENTIVTPQKVTIGVKGGYNVPVVTATVPEYIDHEVEIELNDTDNIHIPNDVKFVKVIPAWVEVLN